MSTSTRPSTIGFETGAGAGRNAEAPVRGGVLPLISSDGIHVGSGGQSEESPGQSQQPQNTVTTGNDTVPATATTTTRTTTTTTVSGLPTTTTETGEINQDSDDDPLGILLDNVEMEERGRRWCATLPRETITSTVDQVPVSTVSAGPNPVTPHHTITRPAGTAWQALSRPI